MPDEELAELIAVIRPMVKGHIRQTRNVLAFLAKLDELLDKTDSPQGGTRNGRIEKQALRVG